MKSVDYLVIGGGFYGCSLALFLKSVSSNIMIVEAGDSLMNRASRVNQARVHTGFHYPRSVLTAVKSMALHRRFARDFPDAVVGDFEMLYAIARRRSKVSAKRFYRMYKDIGAPIAPATAAQQTLFDGSMIEAVFTCTEHAFDYSVLRTHMSSRLEECKIDVQLNTEVLSITEMPYQVLARLSDGQVITAKHVFNVSYAQINSILRSGGLPEANLKHELAEIALVRPPHQLAGYGVTIMDGPFLSIMPYPAENLYSLTHVRYTPHASWTDKTAARSPYAIARDVTPQSRYRHMILDGVRYMPCLVDAEWVRSIFDVKTVLLKNEDDDGRPILYQRLPSLSRVTSILGGKIDNIYDLFDLVRTTRAECREAHENFVAGGQSSKEDAA
ncbi:FAD-dependent oxidoreductase [Rhizobium sp. LCM 4573]|uniref:FAD-dependent oxidoreductase n=1 Tax=Rhizobium sp. LCM 4573 TaxID=1848291 RepID=UPI0008DA74BC|nr:FAD-dependent oxidoreductase [Rhizobium sp. LCM 4573]OHV77112.1 hypothetical protein LCM4573_10100 [Rhizobium sp. LCM 4573]